MTKLNTLLLHPQRPTASHLNRAVIILGNFPTQVRRGTIGVVTQGVADSVLRDEDQEFIVFERQTELLVDVAVVFRSLVTSTAGTMESRASVDARSGHITAVLAGKGIASATCWGWVGNSQRGGRDKDGEERKLHLEHEELVLSK